MECKMEFKAVKFAKTALKKSAIRHSRNSSAEKCRLIALWQSNTQQHTQGRSSVW